MGQILTDVQTVGIGATVNNVLTGKFGRVLQEPSKVTVAITAQLVTAFATVIVGREILMDGQELDATNAAPRNPEDVLVQTFGERGDEIIVKVRNANAATNIVRSKVFTEQV